MRDIGALQPPVVVRHPPDADRTRASKLIWVHHAPVIEGKVVIAPASISPLGRAEIPAGAALLDQTGELLG
jgi:hypothetical protein